MILIRWTARRRSGYLAGTAPGPVPLASLITEASWQPLVQRQSAQPYWKRLEQFVQQQWQQRKVFPPRELTFRALNSVPLDSVRVVILGQVRATSGQVAATTSECSCTRCNLCRDVPGPAVCLAAGYALTSGGPA